MNELAQRIARWWTPHRVLAAGFMLFVAYAYPGFMSSDSVLQLLEARSHIYANPHPPVMAAEWTVLDTLVSGPILMLLLQGALFLGGVYSLFKRVMTPRRAAVIATAVLWFPPIVTPMAVIWKDSQMAAYLVIGIAALLSARRSVRLGGLALLTMGFALRYNGFAAGVPIVGLMFEWTPGARWWKRYAISGLATIAAFVTATATNRLLTVQSYPLMPAVADIVGVLTFTRDRTDDDLRHVLRDTPIRVTTNIQVAARAHYSPRNPYGIDHGVDRLFDPPRSDLQVAALSRAWRELVTGDWTAYVQYRLAGFEELIGWTDEPPWSAVYNGFVEADIQAVATEHDSTMTWFQVKVSNELAELTVETPLFRPYMYIGLALVLLVLCRTKTELALLVSGLLYELSFGFAGGTPDFRYSHWLIVATVVAYVLIFSRRFNSRVAAREGRDPRAVPASAARPDPARPA